MLLCLGLCLGLLAPAQAQPPRRQPLLARGDQNYPPYEFLDQNGEPAGFNLDMIRAVARVMGLKISLSLGPWDQVRRQLEAGEIDLISGMYHSAQRAKLVDFSAPHLVVTYAIFTRRDSEIKSLDALDGRQVLVEKGDYADDYLTRRAKAGAILRADSPARALGLLAQGQGDCALLPRLSGVLLLQKQDLADLTTQGPPVLPRKYCFAVRKGDQDLLAALNEGLGILHGSGEYQRIYDRWFGQVERRSATTLLLRGALLVMLPLGVVLALVLLWIWSLRRQVARKTQELVQELGERKRAQAALIESEQRLRNLADNLPRAVVYQVKILPDGKRQFTYVSGNVSRLNQVSAEEVLADAQVLYSQIDPSYIPALAAAEEQSLANLETFHFEAACRLPDGQRRWLDLSSTPRHGDDGSVIWDGVQVDVTERVQHQQEKNRLESQLRQAQKMEAIGTLAGGIAHDFNNILGAVMGYAEIAREQAQAGQPPLEELTQILAAAERARNLVRQILAFSRKVETNPRPLDLNQPVRQTLAMLRHTLPKMVQISTILAPDLPLVNADPIQVEQILINLANNAADAMPEGGRLLVETASATLNQEFSRLHLEIKPGAYVLLQVSDTGTGMDQATQEKIFDPFFTTKEVGKGTGLGLSTVFGLVKGHGGHLHCHSEPGLGTTFKIYLPVHQDQTAPAGPASAIDQEKLRGKERILLVDDEKALRDLGGQALEAMGYQVLTAASGEEALKIFQDQGSAVDLVVLDLGMPGMGGHKCLQRVLELNPKAKVLIASGYSADDQVKESLKAGAAGFVAKPFRRADLLVTVRKVLDGH